MFVYREYAVVQASNGHMQIYEKNTGKLVISVSGKKEITKKDIQRLIDTLIDFNEREMSDCDF